MRRDGKPIEEFAPDVKHVEPAAVGLPDALKRQQEYNHIHPPDRSRQKDVRASQLLPDCAIHVSVDDTSTEVAYSEQTHSNSDASFGNLELSFYRFFPDLRKFRY